MTSPIRSRSSKWFRTIVQGVMASTLVMIGLVSFSTVASANAANPDPTTVGTLTTNAGGTVTVNLSGTWTWASQATCSGRYGEGWAVDWWGISTSSTPNPNFNLSNATEVNPPGTTTTGTVSPTGSIGLPGSKFFHVGQYLSGEAVNATPGVCTVTSSGIKGAWSASATYPTDADVPAQICVNMYDLHSVTNANDFSPKGNGDNSIQTNAFDPTSDNRYCTQIKPVNVPTSTTTQVNHSTIALGPNGTLSDNVTVTGTAAAGQPAGTVAFYVCGPTTSNALCASTTHPVGTAMLPAATDSGFTSTGTSGTFTPHQVGTYCFAAVYTPATGSSYAGSTDNQTSPNGTPDPAECSSVTAATSVTTTSASSSSIILGPAPGGSVTDHVTVTGTPNAGLPTGTVAFYVCGPTAANAVCTSTAKPEGTATLPATSDTGDVSTGTSNVSFTPTQVGTYCFAAVFTPAPGGNYATSNGNQSTLENSECFTAGAASSTTTTTASSHSITIGPNGTVTDSVTVTGTPNGGLPTGTVNFYVCGPTATNVPCTSTAKSEGSAPVPAATDSGDVSTGTSTGFSPTTPGIYCFAAVFVPATGSNYTTSADNNSTTLDPAECFNVGSAPNISVVKTSDPATGTTVVPGQHIGYTLTASNSGTEASGSVTIADPIPANSTYVAGSASCGTVPNCTPSFANNTVTFTITSVAGGASGLALTFGVTVNANATVTIDNVATVTGPPGCTTAPGCPTNHTDNPVAAFHVIKTSNPTTGTTVVPGQTIGYTLTASNAGDGATGQEVVTDHIPANSTYVAGSASCGTVPHCTAAFANNTVTFTLTTVAPGASGLAMSFNVTVNANATVTIDNVATITGPGCTTPTACPTNHTDNPVASFHVAKTSNPATGTTVVPGQAIGYTLTASNTGDAATGQEVVTDPVPGNATYVAGSANCGTVPNCTAAFTANTNTVTFTLTSVAAGASGLAMSFMVTVNANATVTIDNVATITGPGCTTPTACPTNHTDNPVAAFRVLKSASPPSGATVTPGQVITYTLTASNAGDAATGQEVVTDQVPANSTYVANSASCGTVQHCTAAYVTATNTVTFTLTTVAAGATNQNLTFRVTVNNNPTGTTIVNTATITGAGCSTGCPTNSTTHTVLNPAVLTVSKVGCATTAVPGETFTYTILYANTGGGDSTNTVLTDILPPASQAIVTNPGGGTATTVGGHAALVWNLGTLPHNTSGAKTVQFLVTGSAGSITNVATIASSNAAVTASTVSSVTTPISTAGANTHGNAYAATVGLLGLPLINQLGNVSTQAPGAPQNAANQLVPTLGLPGLVLLGLISQSSHSSVSTSAQSTASSEIAGVNLLNGAITADVIRAQSHSVASVADNTHDSFGSSFVNLKVNGVPLTTVAPNTTVNVTVGTLTVAQVILYQDSGTVTHVGSFNVVTDTVNMINVTLLAPFGILPAGAQIIIGHAATDATFPGQNPACGGTQGAVSGEAFTAAAQATLFGSPLVGAVVGDAVLPITGGAAANGVNGTFIPGLAASGTATDATAGSLAPWPHSSSDSRIEGLNVLNGLITADVVDASCSSAAVGGTAATLLATNFVNLRVGGIVLSVAIAPNTTIAIPYNGGIVDLVLNEQTRAGNGITDTSGTVNALHLYVLNGSGLLTLEVIVASAHCDAHTGL